MSFNDDEIANEIAKLNHRELHFGRVLDALQLFKVEHIRKNIPPPGEIKRGVMYGNLISGDALMVLHAATYLALFFRQHRAMKRRWNLAILPDLKNTPFANACYDFLETVILPIANLLGIVSINLEDETDINVSVKLHYSNDNKNFLEMLLLADSDEDVAQIAETTKYENNYENN
jgi:hypothetical protein